MNTIAPIHFNPYSPALVGGVPRSGQVPLHGVVLDSLFAKSKIVEILDIEINRTKMVVVGYPLS